jgi:hypothetical protein
MEQAIRMAWKFISFLPGNVLTKENTEGIGIATLQLIN